MSVALDRQETFDALDPSRLRDRIRTLPEQMRQAWDAAASLPLPPPYSESQRLVVLGMGGSGIGGALLRGLAAVAGARVPVELVRGYAVPAYVDERSLVVASSNSGNTEETVAALGTALAAGARCVVVATGGRLLELARARELPALTYAWSHEPRSALGWSFAPLLNIASRMGMLPDQSGAFGAALDAMRAAAASLTPDRPVAANPAKRIALRVAGRVPVIVGGEALAPVAYRWRTQMNENGKSWGIELELPEMNHNAPVGYGLPRRVVPLLHAILLRQASLHPRNAHRVTLTEEQMRAHGIDVEVVDVAGASVLEQMLLAVQLGDWVSYYAGILNGVDPSPITALDDLKERMSRFEA